MHHLGLIGLGAALVNDGEVNIELFGDSACADYATDIGGNHHQIVVVLALDVVEQNRRAVDVVHRHVEEALNLVGVQIHGHDPVDASLDHGVGHHLGRDRYPGGTYPAVLACIAEVGHHGSNSASRGATQRIDHQHQFHQVVVGRCAGGLQNEDVLAANIFVDLDRDLTIAELPDRGITHSSIETLGNFLGELGVGIPGENHQF